MVTSKPAYKRGDLITLRNIADRVGAIKAGLELGHNVVSKMVQLRQDLDHLPFFEFLTPTLVRDSLLLHDERGLPLAFDPNGMPFPPDLADDALCIFRHLRSGNLNADLLAGIRTADVPAKTSNTSSKKVAKLPAKKPIKSPLKKSTKSLAKKLVKPSARALRSATATIQIPRGQQAGYAYAVSCSRLGDNGLVNGQWWPMLVCVARDGGHGEIMGGIHGSAKDGAYSVLVCGRYKTVDTGDMVEYLGPDGKPSTAKGSNPGANLQQCTISRSTGYLITSHRTAQPVRLFRSSKLPASNPFRPQFGVRYDGLYKVAAFTIIDHAKMRHQFRLERCAGQSPLRAQGVAARPSPTEVLAYRDLRMRCGYAVSAM